jgi:hypothetical protein
MRTAQETESRLLITIQASRIVFTAKVPKYRLESNRIL